MVRGYSKGCGDVSRVNGKREAKRLGGCRTELETVTKTDARIREIESRETERQRVRENVIIVATDE